MYIKLTRFDNSPIWLNGAFIVTIEPRKEGGSIVVPVGDGLDYDVKESPEEVLALLNGVPAPAILPIPSKEALVLSPKKVSQEAETKTIIEETPVEDKKPTKAKTATKTKTAAKKKATTTATVKKPRISRKKKPALPFTEEQIERLRKMGPKSLSKLQNTLNAQFKITNIDDAIAALSAHEIITLEQNHILWSSPTPTNP